MFNSDLLSSHLQQLAIFNAPLAHLIQQLPISAVVQPSLDETENKIFFHQLISSQPEVLFV